MGIVTVTSWRFNSEGNSEYGAKFFANGANPGGVLEHPGVVKDPKRVRES